MIEKQISYFVTFFVISGTNNQNLTLPTYDKLRYTYTGLLLNFKIFTSFSYKISLIKCLIDRFKICNNHNDIESIKSNITKNVYLSFLIDKVIEKYLNYKFSSDQNQLKDTCDVHYSKSPYIRNLLQHIKNQLRKLWKGFCQENANIKLVFTSFKI